MIIAAVLK